MISRSGPDRTTRVIPYVRRGCTPRRLVIGALVVGGLLLTDRPVAAQDLHPSRRPSPIGVARTHLGDTYVKITYGRPYMRDRSIFGAPGDTVTYLVPFGEVWRTGANEATEITVTGPVLVAGNRLEAGTYSIFTVPGPQSWSVRFNPALGLDGTNRFDAATNRFTAGYDPDRDVVRVDAPVRAMEEVVDQFTMLLEPTAAGADLVMRWERTEIRLPLAVPGG